MSAELRITHFDKVLDRIERHVEPRSAWDLNYQSTIAKAAGLEIRVWYDVDRNDSTIIDIRHWELIDNEELQQVLYEACLDDDATFLANRSLEAAKDRDL